MNTDEWVTWMHAARERAVSALEEALEQAMSELGLPGWPKGRREPMSPEEQELCARVQERARQLLEQR